MSYVVGNRLLISRRDLGLTQKELARRVGIDRSYISQMENGANLNIGVKTIFSMAQTLGVSAAYLLGLSDDPLGIVDDVEPERMVQESDIVYGAMGATARQIVALLPSLSEGDRSFVLQMVERLAGAKQSQVIGSDE